MLHQSLTTCQQNEPDKPGRLGYTLKELRRARYRDHRSRSPRARPRRAGQVLFDEPCNERSEIRAITHPRARVARTRVASVVRAYALRVGAIRRERKANEHPRASLHVRAKNLVLDLAFPYLAIEGRIS